MTNALYLVLCCVFFALQFVFTKLYERGAKPGLAGSLWSQIVTSLAALLFLAVQTGFSFTVRPASLFYAFLFAFFTIINVTFTLLAMGCGDISAVGIWCLAGGMILPYLYGILFRSESSGVLRTIGMLLILVSMIPALAKKKEKGERSDRWRFFWYCAVVFLSNGFILVAMRMHQDLPDPVPESSFMFETAVVRLILSLVLIAVIAVWQRSKGEKNVLAGLFWEVGKTRPMTGRAIALLALFSALIALANTLGNLFSLRCMIGGMEATVQFPLQNEVVIVLTTLFGLAFFREKIGWGKILSLILSAAGIVAIAFSTVVH